MRTYKFLAGPAADRTAIFPLTPKELFLWVFDDSLVLAKGTLLQAIYLRVLDLFLLFDAMIQV